MHSVTPVCESTPQSMPWADGAATLAAELVVAVDVAALPPAPVSTLIRSHPLAKRQSATNPRDLMGVGSHASDARANFLRIS